MFFVGLCPFGNKFLFIQKKKKKGLVKEFIWANPSFKEEPKSNQVFEGIGANKEVQKSKNIIMAIDGNNPHDFCN